MRGALAASLRRMGTNIDAMLIYGIPLVVDAFPKFNEHDPDAPKSGPSFMSFHGNKEDGVVLQHHCSNKWPMYFVAIDELTQRAHRGYPARIYEIAKVDVDLDKRLSDFCEKHHLVTSDGPGWYLASYWG